MAAKERKKERNKHDMECCKEANIGKNVELPEENQQDTVFQSINEQEFVVEPISEPKDEEHKSYWMI